MLAPPTITSKRRRILYVSQTIREGRPYFDPSTRYRCFNFAERARECGHSAYVATQRWFEQQPCLPAFDAYIFHRPKLSPEFIEAIEKLPTDSVKIADYDDLVFDVSAAPATSAVRSRDTPVWSVRRALSENFGAMMLFDNITVSTSYLQAAALRLMPEARVTVLPNVPDEGYMAVAEEIAKSHRKRSRRIGYFSGTNSHNEDLAMVADQVASFCIETGAEFNLVGPVEVPKVFADSRINLKRSKIEAFYKMPYQVAQCRFVIAPLTDSVFNSSKSGIKFMEAGLLSTPVVATPIPDIARFNSSLLYKADSSDIWTKLMHDAWESSDEENLQSRDKVQMQLRDELKSYEDFFTGILS